MLFQGNVLILIEVTHHSEKEYGFVAVDQQKSDIKVGSACQEKQHILCEVL